MVEKEEEEEAHTEAARALCAAAAVGVINHGKLFCFSPIFSRKVGCSPSSSRSTYTLPASWIELETFRGSNSGPEEEGNF